MVCTINYYNYDTVLNFLKKMSPQFSPPLDDTLDLDKYANKLAKNATFLTCNYNGYINGIIVFYPNQATYILYIPLLWVDKDCRGNGIAKAMIKYLIEVYANTGFLYIDLEVLKNNDIAYKLYFSLGFKIIEDRFDKYLMRYLLNNSLY